jgi:hypothetical protein
VGCPVSRLELEQGKGQGRGLERGKTTFLLPAKHLRDGQVYGFIVCGCGAIVRPQDPVESVSTPKLDRVYREFLKHTSKRPP